MSDEITGTEYEEGVASIAAELAEEARSGEFGVGDDARENFSERLWETIDGHSWVIYTSQAQRVVCLSDNDSYSIENFGVESVVQDGGIKWSALAFGALYADVVDALGQIDDFDVNDPNPEGDDDE